MSPPNETITCPCWSNAVAASLGKHLHGPDELAELVDEAFPDPHPQIVAFLFDVEHRVIGVVPVAPHWLPEARRPWQDLLDDRPLLDWIIRWPTRWVSLASPHPRQSGATPISVN